LVAAPHESTFSRAFAEFAASELPSRLHEALIRDAHEDRLVGPIARDATADATAIEGRAKPPKNRAKAGCPEAEKPKRKTGRPRKGEGRPPQEPRRIEKQAAGMGLGR
jgi:hypothetical protein